MDNIKKLEEIGLKKVSDETHIELKYLKYMVDSDFDKLNHINTLGFVKILSREYGIDLSAWADAFEEYWQTNRKEEEDDGLFIVIENQKEGKKLFTFLIILVLIVIGAFSFTFLKDRLDMPQFSTQEEQQSFIPNETVEETKASLEGFETQQSSMQEESSKLEEEPLNTQESFGDVNATKSVENNETIQEESLAVEEEVLVQEEKKQESEALTSGFEDTNTTANTVAEGFGEELVIEPKAKLWIGVVYLDDFSRRSYLGEEPFALDLSRDQIITTGHGSFNVKGDEYEKSFSKQTPIRLWIKDKNVTQISWSKFKELNQGSAW